VSAGNATSYTATVTPNGGFTGNVTMSVSGLPTGATGTFTPNPVDITSGAQNSTLNVTTSATTPAGTYTLTITGTSGTLTSSANVSLVVTIPVTLTPASASFGSVAVGTPSTVHNFTLNNVSGSSITISGVSFTGTNAADFSQTNTCGSILATGKTCTISVTFTPSIAGAESATLSVSDSASNSPQTASLSGTGIADATLTPASIAFGSVPQDTPSAVKNFTLKNNEPVALTVSIGFTGTNATDFTETDTCAGSVAAKSACTISVTFTPSIIGAESASLAVSTSANAPYNNLNSSLVGTGEAQATATPASLTFSAQKVGTSSGAKNVTLKNNLSSSLPFTVSFTGADPGDFSATNSCSGTVAAKSTCTVSVTFKPTATGTRTATLDVTDSANNSPQTVSLTGTGK